MTAPEELEIIGAQAHLSMSKLLKQVETFNPTKRSVSP